MLIWNRNPTFKRLALTVGHILTTSPPSHGDAFGFCPGLAWLVAREVINLVYVIINGQEFIMAASDVFPIL
jgi:hypothetical protein